VALQDKSPLHEAIFQPELQHTRKLVALLLAYPADVNLQDHKVERHKGSALDNLYHAICMSCSTKLALVYSLVKCHVEL